MAKKLFIDFVWIFMTVFFAYVAVKQQQLWLAIMLMFIESMMTEYLHYLTNDEQ